MFSTMRSLNSRFVVRFNGQFQVTVFVRFCYVLLCNHEYIHCLNHRQAKDYIIRRNETERNLNLKEGIVWTQLPLCACCVTLFTTLTVFVFYLHHGANSLFAPLSYNVKMTPAAEGKHKHILYIL